ncbi:MAG: Ig-like domain-containing protein [Gammaproteobacteria bacterium]|nr:Ig-like domain-containing protein [Gammaproteobacteria bacterium]
MKSLPMVRKRVDASRRLSVLNLVRTTALLTMGAFSLNALAQTTTCEFDEVTAGTNWQVVGGENQIVFYQGTGASVTIPNFTDDGCVGSGATSFRLFKNGVQITDLTDGTDDDVIRLLRRVTGVTVTDVGVTATDDTNGWGDEHTITYDGTDTAWGAAPVEYMVQAARAFTDVLGEFTFTVTVLPTQLTIPTSVVFKAESTESIVVRWVGDDVAGTATHYQVGWRTTGTTSYTMCGLKAENTPASETTHFYSIQGLEAGTGYEVAVRAVNPGSMTNMYDDAYSPFSTPTFDADEHTTKSPMDDATPSAAINDMNPIRIATGQIVSVNAMEWIFPHIDGETVTDSDPFHATGTTFTYRTRSGNNSALRVEFIDDGDTTTTDHVIRLTGLAEATTYAIITAEGSDGSELRTEIPVKVGTNAEQIFSVTSATTRWDLETTAANFELDASDFVSEADDTIEYSMTGGTHRGVTYLEIAEDTGVISVPAGINLSPLESGDEFELTVTATNGNQGTDSIVIYVNVVEGDDAPFLKPGTADVWLKPLSEANGGGSRVVNLAQYFDDRDGGRLCFSITGDTTDIGTSSNPMVVADVRLSGASQCRNAQLTVTMNLPSTNPSSDDFSLLNLLGVVEVDVDVAAYQEGDSTNTSDPVTVKIKLAYGANASPSIRAVARAGAVHIASGGYTVDENSAFTITFTADDPLPNPRRSNSNTRLSHDDICWSDSGKCMPCVGPENRMSDRIVNNGVSHEFDLTVPAAKVDYEKHPNGYVIDLCATDLSGTTHTTQFTVMIEDVEEPPTFKPIEDMYFVVGDYGKSIDLADFIQDGDGERDIVRYEANTVGTTTAVEVSESDGVVTVTPTDQPLARKAEVEIEVSATDTSGYRAYGYFTANVKNSNRSPTFRGGIGSVSYAVAENSPAKTKIGTPIEATDPDVGDDITYELSGSQMFGIDTTTNGAQLVLRKAGLDYEQGNASYDLVLTANDGYGGAATLRITVAVTDVNEPPVATDEVIKDQRILLGMTECVIRASDHFSDPDESDQASGLLIEATTTRPGDVAVTISNNDVCIEGRNVGTGPARITVTARDRAGHTAHKRFKVTVEQNNPPMTAATGGLEDLDVQRDGRSEDIDLNEYFDDGDDTYDETMEYSVSSGDANIATAVVVRGHYLRIYGNLDGTTTVTVTATDQNNQSHSQTFDVTVVGNEAPVANPNAIADVQTRIGQTPAPIDAGEAFTDEGDSFTLSVGTDNTDVATLSVEYDADNNPWITVHVHSIGSTRATVTAVDTAQNTATVSFNIEVGERNDPPKLASPIADLSVEIDGRVDIDLDEVFDDEGRLSFEVDIEDDNVADVVYRSISNILRVYGYKTGDTLVSVTATDDIGQTATDEFTVTVVEGAAPEVVAVPVAQSIHSGGVREVSLNGVFVDPDGGALTYSASSSNEMIATVMVSGSTLQITGVSEGNATITVRGTDAEGLYAEVMFDIAVGPADVPPMLAIPFKDLTLEMGKNADVTLDGVFEDDGTLTYSVTVDDDDVAHAVYRQSNNSIRVYGDAIGTAMVTVTATDASGQSASDSFMVTVEIPNNPPVVAKTIDGVTIEAGDYLDVSLDGVFKDEGELDYTVTSDSDTVADAVYRVSTNSVRVFALEVGMANITVTATDDVGQTARTSFQVDVDPANDAPTLSGTLDNTEVTVGESTTVSLAGVFTDPDGDTLSYAATTSDEMIATVSVTGIDLTIEGKSAGIATITVTATDPGGLSATGTFSVDVETAPMLVQDFADEVVTAGEPLTFAVDKYFMDDDGDTLTYSASSSDELIATVSVTGMDLTIDGMSAGTAMITVTATDPKGRSASGTFDVVIETAPMLVMEFDDRVVTAGMPDTFSVADNFADEDGDMLTFSSMSSDDAIAMVSVSDDDLTIDGMSAGTATITVTAADPKGRSTTGEFEVVVETAPMLIMEFDDQVVTAGEPMMLQVANHFADEDGDTLTYSAMSSDTAIATVSLSGEELTLNGVAAGTATITVTASDPKDRSASGTFEVVVETAPMLVMDFDDKVVTAGMPYTFSIADNFADEDGDTLTYSAMSSDDAIAMVSVSGDDLTIDGMSAGMATITVTAADPKGRSASGEFDVVVETAPMLVMEFDDQVVTAGEPMTLQVANHFADEDGDTLTYSAMSSDTAIATVSMSGEDLTLNGVSAGMATVTVTASDPKDRSASGTFEVVVETAPEAVGNIADMMLQVGGEAMEMDLTGYFADGDGDALTYAASTDTDSVETAVSGAMLTLTPHTKGQSVVTVVASDPKQRQATQEFTVTVDDGEIKAVGNDALAGVARTIIGSASNAIGGRLEGNRGNTSGLSFLPIIGGRDDYQRVDSQPGIISANTGTVGPAPRTQQPAQRSSAPMVRKASSGVTWGMVPSKFQDSSQSRKVDISSLLGNNFSYFLNGNGGMGSFSGWGTVDFRSLEGEGYDGNASAFFLGVDVKVSPYVLLGAAVGHNRSETDYTYGSATQTLETTVTSVLPYVSYKPNPRAIVWGVVGRGGGEATTTVHNATDSESSDLTMNLGMFGASARFASRGATQFGIRGDAAFASLATEDGNGAADGLDAGVNRLRIGAEAMHVYGMADGSTVTPYGEINLRYDGGDGVTGSGIELAGGVRIMTNAFSLDARGHTVAAHSAEDFSESGVTLMATLNPSHGMTGLSMSLAPSWGQTSRPQSLVWADSAAGALPFNTGFRSHNGFAMNANIGYGFLINRDRHVLTPYLEYGEDGARNRSILLGTEVKQLIMSSSLFDMNVTVGRVGSTSDSDNNQLEINATLLF